MTAVLSQVLDARTLQEPRRLELYRRFSTLRSMDLYIRRSDLVGSALNETHRALDMQADRLHELRMDLESVRVFVPPYAARTADGGYAKAAHEELERVLEISEHLQEILGGPVVGLSFHHVTEWPLEIDKVSESACHEQLKGDLDHAIGYIERVVSECRVRQLSPLLENVAPVRNDHAFPGAMQTPRYETGYCSPLAMASICEEVDGLRAVLDVCHLALGCEAARIDDLPRINQLEIGNDPSFDEEPAYRFEAALETLGPFLDCVHLSGCGGPQKEVHEGGVPGEAGDQIDLDRLLHRLAALDGIAITLEIGGLHKDAMFPKLERSMLGLDEKLRVFQAK